MAGKWKTATIFRTASEPKASIVEFPNEKAARKAYERARRETEFVIVCELYNASGHLIGRHDPGREKFLRGE